MAFNNDRDGAEMYRVASVLAALGHKLRLEVWCILAPSGSRGLPVGSIAAQLAVPPSVLLFHLQQMTQAGILLQRRSNHQTIYAVDKDVLDRSCDFIKVRSVGQAIEATTAPSTEQPADILG